MIPSELVAWGVLAFMLGAGAGAIVTWWVIYGDDETEP